MNIDELKVSEVRAIAEMLGFSEGRGSSHSFEIGQSYLIRTDTLIYTGRVVAVTASDIQLETAARILDTGRFYSALKSGRLIDVEPYPDGCFVSRAPVVEFSVWRHALPGDQC